MSILTADHPYYGSGEFSEHYDSWEDFISDWADADPDYNHLYRWDVIQPDPDDEDVVLSIDLFFVQQRRGSVSQVTVNITPDDEPAITAYLQERYKLVQALWAPIGGRDF